MNNKIKIATVFSGIGSPEEALRQLKQEYSIKFACDNGERMLSQGSEQLLNENHFTNEMEMNSLVEQLYLGTGKPNLVEKTYKANFEIDDDAYYQDVRYLDGKKYKGCVDLFIGGSPCQSFSIMGKRKGLDEARGTLFYEFARLVKEIEPKVFIYENVPGMLNHDSGKTWEVITRIFSELGYSWTYWILNAKDYGLAQNRRRLFVVGYRQGFEKCFTKLAEPTRVPLTTITADYLESSVDNKYYLPEKGFYRVTEKKNSKYVAVNTTLSRCQVACQQYNWFGDMRFETNYPNRIENDPRIFKGVYKGERGVTRCLTPRECLRLMGFADSYKIVVPDAVMYRQVGNSIAVNVIKSVIKEIIDTGVLQ